MWYIWLLFILFAGAVAWLFKGVMDIAEEQEDRIRAYEKEHGVKVERPDDSTSPNVSHWGGGGGCGGGGC